MQGTGIGHNIVEIFSLLIFVGLISMFVRNADKTSQLIKSGSDAAMGLIDTATGSRVF